MRISQRNLSSIVFCSHYTVYFYGWLINTEICKNFFLRSLHVSFQRCLQLNTPDLSQDHLHPHCLHHTLDLISTTRHCSEAPVSHPTHTNNIQEKGVKFTKTPMLYRIKYKIVGIRPQNNVLPLQSLLCAAYSSQSLHPSSKGGLGLRPCY